MPCKEVSALADWSVQMIDAAAKILGLEPEMMQLVVSAGYTHTCSQ